jgi:hypothetical protein
MARGLALKKMTPDALMSFFHKTEKSQGQDRLRKYFFGEDWDKLPQVAIDNLINADRLFWSHEGAHQSIFNHLRLACEAVLEVGLWGQYSRWLQNRTIKDLRDLVPARNEKVYGTFLGQFLKELRESPKFRSFVDGEYPDSKAFICGDLRIALDRLLYLRNPAEHPQQRSSQPSARRIQDVYREFIGIGRVGILQRLVKIEPRSREDSHRQPQRDQGR